MRSSGFGSTGSACFPVSDVEEAVSRFEAGSMILLVGDGVAPPAELVAQLAEQEEPAVATVPDDEAHATFERIDAESRWAGVAVVDSHLLGSTAAMLGDWDLQSTLLRRTLQEGALRVRADETGGEPLLAETRRAAARISSAPWSHASRGARTDWASRYILPPVEEFATEQLMETRGPPGVADVGGARADARRRCLLHAGAGSAPGLGCCSLSTPARPGRQPPRDPPPAPAARRGC